MNNVMIAPNIDAIKENNTFDPSSTETNSSISFFGCGGFGINMIRNNHNTFSEYGAHMVTFDTSKANSSGVTDDVTQYFVCNEGSGKVRASNLEKVQTALHEHAVLNNLSDINVIMFSLSGGSGSIIGPLLAKAIAQQGKAVIILTIADNSCRMETQNTIKSIQTLQNLATSNNQYYPLMLFCNMDNRRKVVDETITSKLHIFLDIFASNEIQEIDKSDRINFLTPNKYAGAPAGMYVFDMLKRPVDGEHVEMSFPGEINLTIEPNQVCHSVFSANPEGTTPSLVPLVSYAGISEKYDYVACTGFAIPEQLLNTIKSSLDNFNSKSIPEQNTNSFDFGISGESNHSSGMVV